MRKRLIRWFRRAGFLEPEAAADMLAWEHSGFSIDARVRISLDDRDVPSSTKSLKHFVRYCARPAFALERLTTAMAIGNVGKTVGKAAGAAAQSAKRTDAPDGETGTQSHDTSRLAWAKLLA